MKTLHRSVGNADVKERAYTATGLITDRIHWAGLLTRATGGAGRVQFGAGYEQETGRDVLLECEVVALGIFLAMS
jgi:hypothetical protein